MNNPNKSSNRLPWFTADDLVAAVFGLIFCMFFFVLPVFRDEEALAAAAVQAAKQAPFISANIEAEAAYVYDIRGGRVLFEKNAEAALPLASLTKIMTAFAALEAVPETSIVTIEKEDLELEGDSGLFANEKWQLRDLLALTLIESSNDGAYAVSGAVGEALGGADKAAGRDAFVDFMNRTAAELGLTQTHFSNATGLDETLDIAGGYGSAKDMAILMSIAVEKYPDLFRNTKYNRLDIESLSALPHTAVNTNKGLDSLPIVIASKTGFTDLAGGNLVVVLNAGIGRPYVVVVMHSTENGRFEDVNQLAWATLDYISK